MSRNSWLMALAVLLIAPAAGRAQTSATEPGYAYAAVEQIPITLALTQNLHFGRFAPWGQPGSVSVSATGSPSTTGSNVTILDQGYPSRWTVSGAANAPFTLVLPADRTISVTSGADTMVIDYFFSSYHETGDTRVLGSTGAASFTIGAKLLVGANQSPGSYSGSFPVTVAY